MFNRFLLFVVPLALALTTLSTVRAQDEKGKQEQKVESTVSDPIGYFLGLSVGQQMRQSGVRSGDFDVEGLMAGFTDGMAKKESALTDKQLAETQKKIQSLLQDRRKEQLSESKVKGEAYLVANSKRKGVKQLKGGIQYKVIDQGDGKSPELTDTVKVHYTGKLIDGTMFDSSVKRGEPAVFRVGQVIKGWQMALQKMKVGDKWMLYIPSDLAYGEQGSPGAIGPNEVLVFEVELLAIQ
jgi:FKBP-type peptidyl-prolyl cis-trans isomerase